MLSPYQFGPLYHGTNVPGLSEIDQNESDSFSWDDAGWQFATTDPKHALSFARDNAKYKGGPAVVYEVEPGEGEWGPDPMSRPSNEGFRTKRDAIRSHKRGEEVSLRFRSPLAVRREVMYEDRAQDLSSGRTFT